MARTKKEKNINVIVHYPDNFNKKEFDKYYCQAIFDIDTIIIDKLKNKK